MVMAGAMVSWLQAGAMVTNWSYGYKLELWLRTRAMVTSWRSVMMVELDSKSRRFPEWQVEVVIYSVARYV